MLTASDVEPKTDAVIFPDDDDCHSLALVAWKEARGEGAVGCEAVMWVLKNRVEYPGFAHTLHDCIYGKNQFTSMSVPSDPEFNLSPDDVRVTNYERKIFDYCMKTAFLILSGRTTFDVTLGAHYYGNLEHIQGGGWFQRHIVADSENHPFTIKIRNHSFFI